MEEGGSLETFKLDRIKGERCPSGNVAGLTDRSFLSSTEAHAGNYDCEIFPCRQREVSKFRSREALDQTLTWRGSVTTDNGTLAGAAGNAFFRIA